MRNLEAKFRLADLALARERAEAAGFVYQCTFDQRDTFFKVVHGKLKLREQTDGAWLIHYHRDRAGDLQLSNYSIVPISDPGATRTMLLSALGLIADVRKRRTLLMRANVRLHLDRVADLGQFGEIEAVLADDDSPKEWHAIVAEILQRLEVRTADLLDLSYFELARRAIIRRD